jgi:hypothetical protein
MNVLAIATATVWMDFLFVMLTKKVYVLNSMLTVWYDKYGLVAVLLDCLSLTLAIMLAFFTVPGGSPLTVTAVVLLYQILHDILLYNFVILPLPAGENEIIDLFRTYVNRGGVGTLIGNSVLILSIMGLFYAIHKLPTEVQIFNLLLGIYAVTYAVYS